MKKPDKSSFRQKEKKKRLSIKGSWTKLRSSETK